MLALPVYRMRDHRRRDHHQHVFVFILIENDNGGWMDLRGVLPSCQKLARIFVPTAIGTLDKHRPGRSISTQLSYTNPALSLYYAKPTPGT